MSKFIPVALSNTLFRKRFGLLILSLFGLLLVAAVGQSTPLIDEFFLVTLCFVLIASLYAVERSTHHMRLFVTGGIIAIAGNIAGYVIPGVAADVYAACASFLFLCWVMFLLFVHIFTNRKVTEDTIMGAACLYILIGIAFGFLYLIVDYLVPNSFHISYRSGENFPIYGIRSLLDHFFYFSFVTLTTIGYGDMAPISQPARYVAIIEALISQLYLTILLARLVGMHLNQRA